MKIEIRSDSVMIEGYVNAVERNSKPLISRIGRFIERIKKGAFKRALEKGDDVLVLLNHREDRVLGSLKQGNLELHEDSIGLHARATITDEEVIRNAREGNLVGWSFGFYDVEGGVDEDIDQESGLPLRKVRELDLREVSILNREKSPAYEGTLIMARDDSATFIGETFADDVEVIEERAEEVPGDEPEEREEEPEQAEPVAIDYSQFDQKIAKMKGERP